MGYFGTLLQGHGSSSNVPLQAPAARQDQLVDPDGDCCAPPDTQPNIPTEEPELRPERARDSINSVSRITKKANTRAASAHLQQNEGEIVTDREEGEDLRGNALGQIGIGSPSGNRAFKHTHSSVGQHSRKLDLAAQQDEAGKTQQSMTTQDQDVGKIGLYEPKRWAQILQNTNAVNFICNPQRCTCKNMPGPRAPVSGAINNQMKS